MKIERYGIRKIASFIGSAAGLASIGLVATATIAFAITLNGTNQNDTLTGTP